MTSAARSCEVTRCAGPPDDAGAATRKSTDPPSGRSLAIAALVRAGETLRLAAQNLGSELGELLARLGLDHCRTDNRRHPDLRNEFAVIDDLGRCAVIDNARGELRGLEVSAHEPRADLARRREHDLA